MSTEGGQGKNQIIIESLVELLAPYNGAYYFYRKTFPVPPVHLGQSPASCSLLSSSWFSSAEGWPVSPLRGLPQTQISVFLTHV